jgi:sigma-B regulation protein RsbU (phosphoserine phosphatase)
MPKTDRAFLAVMALCSVGAFMSFSSFYARIMIVGLVLSVLVIAWSIYIAFKALLRGFYPAVWYIAAWVLFLAGMIIYSLLFYNIIGISLAGDFIIRCSSVLQVIFHSIGLSYRVVFLKHLLESKNISLEEMVNERTKELDRALRIMERKDMDMQQELDLAGTIQRGILPIMPFYHDGIKIDAFYSSMGKVGGDFFDVFRMKGGYIGVLVADASGHGMPAAFITALAKISFVEAIQMYLFPVDIFRHVNSELINTIKTDDFVTAFFAVISPSFDLFYGNASHQRALVLHIDTLQVEELDTNGIFMGSFPEARDAYEEKQLALSYGDRLLIYTDGITEARNKENMPFGDMRLKELLVSTHSLSVEDAKTNIADVWKAFFSGCGQYDDATLVMIEIDPAYRDLEESRERGFRLLWQRRYREAIGYLSDALAVNPNDEKSHLYIGECYLKNGEFSMAARHLKRYLMNNEIDANVWYHLAQAYFYNADYQEAYRSARKAANLRNDYVDALTICGLSMKNLGDAESAQRYWKRIIHLDREHKIARKELEEINLME